MAGSRSPDMTGFVSGRLTAIRQVPAIGATNHARWLCRCECGKTKEVRASHLRTGNIQSCGCLSLDSEKRRIAVAKAITKHGQATKGRRSREYYSWVGMIQRCTNPNEPQWHDYGGRGITVHPEWRASFKAFFEHVGPKPTPKHTLDRIDNERGYEPGNVRWATRREQLLNKRTTVYLEHDGRRLRAVEWAEITGLSIDVIRTRIQRGWDVSRALTQPLRRERPHVIGQ